MKRKLWLFLFLVCVLSALCMAKTIIYEWYILDEFTLLHWYEEYRDNLGTRGVEAGETWVEPKTEYFQVTAESAPYVYYDQNIIHFSDPSPTHNGITFSCYVREEQWDGIWTKYVEYDDGSIENVAWERTIIIKSWCHSWAWRYLY